MLMTFEQGMLPASGDSSTRINRVQAFRYLQRALKTGKFGSVTVRKRTPNENGVRELRTFNFRGMVSKGVKGTGLRFDPVTKDLVILWDRKAQDFRSVAIEGIVSMKIHGIQYSVFDRI